MATPRGVRDLKTADRLCRERGHDWAEPVDVVTARRNGRIAAFTRTRVCRRSDEHTQTTEDISVATGSNATGSVTKCGADYGLRGTGRVTRAEVLVMNLEDGLTHLR